jgi:hypothetical protein
LSCCLPFTACGHKHVHNKKNFLMPSFHSPIAKSTFTIKKKFLLPSFHSTWIIVTVIDYIDNKRNSITIFFLWCHKYSRWSGWAHFFSCWHKYNRWWNWFAHFFLVAIITIMEGLSLFFSCCHKYIRWWNLFAFFFTMQWWRGAIGL